MKIAEAFNMVRNLCDNVRCTKQERQSVEEALMLIGLELKKSTEPKKEEKK